MCAIVGDQPWHGSLIAKKKLGCYAGPVSKVKAEKLASLITKAVSDTTIGKNAADICEAIKKEDGPLRVHEAIERAFDSYKYPWPMKGSDKAS